MTDAPRFHFTKIRVADLDKEFAFYSAAFNRIEKYRVTTGEGVEALDEIIMTTPDGDEPSLVLLHYPNQPVPTPGSVVIGFSVADVDATTEAAARAGGTVVTAPHDMPEHGIRVAFVQDPEGHLVELFGRL